MCENLEDPCSGILWVYKAAIKRALQEQAISPILRMFFDFGFMDSGLLGEEYTEQLYAVAERLSWVQFRTCIYNVWVAEEYLYRKNEPSKNEFDLDYPAYLADLRRNGAITKKEQEEWKDDPVEEGRVWDWEYVYLF